MNEKQYLKNLEIPYGKIDVVVDTAIAVGMYLECDEQFAIAYMLSYDRFDVKAFYLDVAEDEKWLNMRRNGVNDMLDCCDRQDLKDKVFKGGTHQLKSKTEPVQCEAVEDLVRRAKNYSPENPLYVFAIGPLTNIASALIADPSIADNIVVVWVGGHSFTFPDTAEYNLKKDLLASKCLFESNVPLILIPCRGVSEKLVVRASDVKERLAGSKLGDYLVDFLTKMLKNPADFDKLARIIWDAAAIAVFVDDGRGFAVSEITERPVITDDMHYDFTGSNKKIHYVSDINNKLIAEDMLEQLKRF